MLAKIKEFIGARLGEGSTARGLILLSGMLGYTLSPEHSVFIAEIVIVLLGMIGVVVPDKTKTEAELAVEAAALKEIKDAEARVQLGLDPKA